MKSELIEIINKQQSLMRGGLIAQPVESYVEKMLNNASLLIHTGNGRIAGFIAYYCNDPFQKFAFLTMLCTDPAQSGKGIGSFLLDCSITDLKNRGFSTYELEVKKDNHPAIHLYKKAGFELNGSIGGMLKMKITLIHEG